MNKAKNVNADPLLLRLTASEDTAALALLAQLCRSSRRFTHWLTEDFARDPAIRKRFASFVAKNDSVALERFADLTEENTAWREERRRLRQQLPTRPYGGLARSEVERLIRHYQVGTLDLGTFLLAHHWRAVGGASPPILWAGLHFLEATLPTRQWRSIKQLGKVFAFLSRFENKGRRRGAVGYADWWKVQALFYVLSHPRAAYRTRELLAHLATLGVQVTTKDIRRFCTRHNIRRDMRSGRPRSRLAAAT